MGLFKPRVKHVLNIDVGSASIGLELLSIENGVAKSVVSFRKQIEFSKTLNYNKFLKDTENAIRKSFEILIKKTHMRPDEVHCFLASPWFFSERREINYQESGKKFVVKKELIDKLSKEEVEQVIDKAEKEYGGKLGKEPDVLELKIVDVQLNGYSTNHPEGKKAESLKIVLFVSIFPVKFKEMMNNLIESNLNTSRVKYHSLPCTALCVLREIKDSPNDFVILDVNGEITDVAIVKDSSISEIISFPIGRNFFWRELSDRMNTNYEETLNTYDLYLKDQIHGTIKDKIDRYIEEIRELWSKAFLDAVSGSDYEFYLPSSTYLLTDHALFGFFSKALESEKLSILGSSTKPFVVVNRKEDNTDWDNQGSDAFLSIERIFIKRAFDIK